MENRAAAQPLAVEIEDGEVAQLCLVVAGSHIAACDRDGSDEVLRVDGELQIAVASVLQLGIEYCLTVAYAGVQQRNDFFVACNCCSNTKGVGDFCAIAVNAQIGELRRGMRKHFGINGQTSLCRLLRSHLNQAAHSEGSELQARRQQTPAAMRRRRAS